MSSAMYGTRTKDLGEASRLYIPNTLNTLSSTSFRRRLGSIARSSWLLGFRSINKFHRVALYLRMVRDRHASLEAVHCIALHLYLKCIGSTEALSSCIRHKSCLLEIPLSPNFRSSPMSSECLVSMVKPVKFPVELQPE